MTRHRLPLDFIDPLAQALHALRISGVFYCQSELSAPWGLTMPETPDCMWFHVLTKGRCELIDEREEIVSLSAGDFVLLTHGQGHKIFSKRGVAAPMVLNLPHDQVSDRFALLRYGGKGAATSLICGVVRMEQHVARNLAGALPSAIRLTDADGMHDVVRLIANDVDNVNLGGEAIVTRLADILVIRAIRSWLKTNARPQAGWLAAFQDTQIGRALALIHQHPETDWTVEKLARRVAMSRSAFAARFATLVGESPMHYVVRVRMGCASDLLVQGSLSVSEVAARFGYESDAAFSRAFKKFAGVSPRTKAGPRLSKT